MTLLNGTQIPYRQLVVPCCRQCNGNHLSPIEDRVRWAVESGAGAVRKLPKRVLFSWLGKILYGLLYREHLLRLDGASKSKRPIIARETLRRFQLHHYFLQGSRVPIKFRTFFPASMLILSTQNPTQIVEQFDFRDSPFALLVSIRMGKVGIVAALQDGGALADQVLAKKLRKVKLHPIQFTEMTAQFFYQESLMNRTPKFMLTEQKGTIHVIQSPLGGLSTKPIFNPPIRADYAKILAGLLRVPLEQIFVPPDQVMGWIRDKKGRLKFIPSE